MTKYIRTKDNKIIVFSGAFTHNQFSSWKPITAGFISFGIDENKNPSCTCYGESISLGLKSDTEKDTQLAKMQILETH